MWAPASGIRGAAGKCACFGCETKRRSRRWRAPVLESSICLEFRIWDLGFFIRLTRALARRGAVRARPPRPEWRGVARHLPGRWRDGRRRDSYGLTFNPAFMARAFWRLSKVRKFSIPSATRCSTPPPASSVGLVFPAARFPRRAFAHPVVWWEFWFGSQSWRRLFPRHEADNLLFPLFSPATALNGLHLKSHLSGVEPLQRRPCCIGENQKVGREPRIGRDSLPKHRRPSHGFAPLGLCGR